MNIKPSKLIRSTFITYVTKEVPFVVAENNKTILNRFRRLISAILLEETASPSK